MNVCMYVQMEIFCSTHTGVNVWRRNLIDLNAQQFWLQQSIDEYRQQVQTSLDSELRVVRSDAAEIRDSIAEFRNNCSSLHRNLQQKEVGPCHTHTLEASSSQPLVVCVCLCLCVLVRLSRWT